MVHPDTAKWDQTIADLLQLALESEHQRTRERWLALYMVASGQNNATQWAKEIGRTDDTVLSWVHCYNDKGPEALGYRHSGGRVPLFLENR
jgi:hypothetical protein